MQFFLGSLDYYSRFIEDYAVYASILYELREVDSMHGKASWRRITIPPPRMKAKKGDPFSSSLRNV